MMRVSSSMNGSSGTRTRTAVKGAAALIAIGAGFGGPFGMAIGAGIGATLICVEVYEDWTDEDSIPPAFDDPPPIPPRKKP